MKQIAFASLVLVYTLAVSPALAQSASRAPGYRIGPRDLLEIRVSEIQALNVSRRVSEDGDIDLPQVGSISMAGLTETEAAQRIKEVLEAKALNRASVSVQITEYRSRPISFLGAVRQPGNLPFSGRWTLLEALTAAGGLTEGPGNVIYVLRRAENGLSDQVAISADDLVVHADPLVNIPIFPGDLINVPVAVDVLVYCLGEVQQPGAITFKSSERITLLTAIARAGGLTDRAASRVTIKRSGGLGGQQSVLTADYKRILAGKDLDIELKSGDVLVIKESFF